jgi:hypothetical protein
MSTTMTAMTSAAMAMVRVFMSVTPLRAGGPFPGSVAETASGEPAPRAGFVQAGWSSRVANQTVRFSHSPGPSRLPEHTTIASWWGPLVA